jgi:putative transposase
MATKLARRAILPKNRWSSVPSNAPSIATKPKHPDTPDTTPYVRITNAILYVLKTGSPWRQLPHDLPPWKTVYYPFRRWEKRGVLAQIRDALKTGAGAGGQRGAQVSCGGQSVCTVHRKGGARGYDGGKQIKGRKRHLVVDWQGRVLGVWVSPADKSDARGARGVLEQVLRRYPSVQMVIADGVYDKES